MEAREGYKKTKLGWIPEDWGVNTLDQLANILMGQSPSSKSYNEENTGLPLIQGNADIKKRTSSPRIWTSQPTKTCEIDDILMTVRAPVGAIAKSAHKACIGRGVCAIRPTISDNSFLYQTLISLEPKWKAIEQGSTFTAVNGKDIKNIQIPTPPLPEQQKIAEILTTVDDKIASIENRIQQTEQLKKGLMEKLLTEGIGHTEFKDTKIGRIPASWDVVKVVDSGIDVIDGDRGTHYPKQDDFTDDGFCLFLSAKNVSKTGFRFEERQYISEEKNRLLRKGKLERNDIVITTRGTVGNISWYKNDVPYDHIRINSGMALLRQNNENYDYSYLYILLRSDCFQKQVKLTAFGSAQPQLTIKEIKKFRIITPPIPEQKQIANILSTVDDKLDVLRYKKSNYETLKKGLMEQLLTGKMRVKP